MQARRLVIAAIVVALLGAGAAVVALAAAPGSRDDGELKAATKAFTDRGVAFPVTIGPDTWRLMQPGLSNTGSSIPVDLRPHTVGYAVSLPFSRLRAVYVFDTPSAATRFAEILRTRRIPAGDGVLAARDVVYFGLDDKVAHKAMASLAGK